MDTQGFEQQDFETFKIEGLEARMTAIQERIQPKFKQIGIQLVDDLSVQLGNEVYLHIAKHARRTVNPPKDTWLAIADNKRGYKKHPHFQLGLFDDHLFLWLAFIYELDYKKDIAKTFIKKFNEIKQLPEDFVVSLDHTKKDSIPIKDLELKHIERFHDVKKAELLLGKQIASTDSLIYSGEKLFQEAKQTFRTLIPFYQAAMQAKGIPQL